MRRFSNPSRKSVTLFPEARLLLSPFASKAQRRLLEALCEESMGASQSQGCEALLRMPLEDRAE